MFNKTFAVIDLPETWSKMMQDEKMVIMGQADICLMAGEASKSSVATGQLLRPRHPGAFSLSDPERLDSVLAFLGGVLSSAIRSARAPVYEAEELTLKAFQSAVLIELFRAVQKDPTLPLEEEWEPLLDALRSGESTQQDGLVHAIWSSLCAGFKQLLREKGAKLRSFPAGLKVESCSCFIVPQVPYPATSMGSLRDEGALGFEVDKTDEVDRRFAQFSTRVRGFVNSAFVCANDPAILRDFIRLVVTYETHSGLLPSE